MKILVSPFSIKNLLKVYKKKILLVCNQLHYGRAWPQNSDAYLCYQLRNMNLVEPDDISADSVKILWYVCFHPFFNSKWAILLSLINMLICCLYTTLAIIGILLSYNNDLFFMAECLQTCILMTHIICKVLNLHVHRKILISLLEKKSQFWKIADFEKRQEYSKILNIIKNVIRFYFTMSIMAAVFFDLQPFTTGFLPTSCYVPSGSFPYLAALLWYLSCVCVICVPGTDCLFCSLGTSVVVQFKLLGHRFQNIFRDTSDHKIWGELENYCNQLNSIFRGVFLLQFVIAIASASVGAWTNRVKFAIYFVTIITETGFYCIPLEIIADTAQKTAKSVYNSKWHEINKLQFRKCLTLVIARSQKVIVFSGYGMFDMNLKTYVLICKTVLTFYTYLNSNNYWVRATDGTIVMNGKSEGEEER
ncbi:uncharacterized protein LOC135127347 [Zophobas morio]|uniref:uncharacterized protein LOC135127347 n=1 Tax=Zophobas morio TaxID=2755281 RepID=UPI003082E149